MTLDQINSQNELLSIMNNWSLEATLPKKAEIEALAETQAPGTEIYLSTLPHASHDEQIEAARLGRSNGLEPVLHVAARYYKNKSDISAYISRAVTEAKVDRLLLIAGDIVPARGDFFSSIDILENINLAELGINRIGIAGYPDGHPTISDDVLAEALEKKLILATDIGIEVQLVTQFCFDAWPIRSWLAEIRQTWPEILIKIGLAGPTSSISLFKYALSCGVKAPRGGFAAKLGMAKNLVRTISPENILREIGDLPNLSPHFFSFGGLEKTANWARQLKLNSSNKSLIEPVK